MSQDFVSRVSDERAGGVIEAQQEWDRSLDGALTEVLGEHGKFPVHPACDCFIAELSRTSQDNTLFSTGIAGLTERQVMRYLIEAARLGRSVLVQESQRQIAVAIDRHQPTVSHVLKRLEALGWMRRLAAVDPLAPTPYLLLVPEVCTDVSTKGPAGYIGTLLTAGSLVDTNMHTQVHRLFGPAGLGTGVEETFAALPEYRVRVPRGYLVRNLPGFPVTPGLLNPFQGSRQIPRPAQVEGMTVLELVEVTGKHRSTTSRHLKILLDRRLVLEESQQDGLRRWWRLRFDPDQVADRDEVPHTAQLKAEAHIRERRSYFRGRIRSDQVGNRTPSVQQVHGPDGDAYMNVRTGEVLWIDSDPPETNPDTPSGP